jgi:hypothetical protein
MKRIRQEDAASSKPSADEDLDAGHSEPKRLATTTDKQSGPSMSTRTEVKGHTARRIYLVDGNQAHVKFAIESSPDWRFVDYAGGKWSLVQHEKPIDIPIEVNEDGTDARTDLCFFKCMANDMKEIGGLMQKHHVDTHTEICMVLSVVPLKYLRSKK